MNIVKAKLFSHLTFTLIFLFILLSLLTLRVPVIDQHSMKSVNNIQISRNLSKNWDLKKTDAAYNYVFFSGNLIGNESPLSIVLLACVYTIYPTDSVTTNMLISRIFSFLHVLLAMLIIFIFLKKKRVTELLFFFCIYVCSLYSLRWSTRALAESYAIFYMVLFFFTLFFLATRNKLNDIYKAAIILMASVLLCIGGKMNYFLISIPCIILFPAISGAIVHKWKYYIVITIAILAGMIAIVCNAEIEFIASTFFSLLSFSIFQFHGIKQFFSNTCDDWGYIQFVFAIISFIYLAFSFYRNIKYKSKGKSELYQSLLFLVLIGILCNMFFLRKWYFAHRYYILSAYPIIMLGLANFLSYFYHRVKKNEIDFTRKFTNRALFISGVFITLIGIITIFSKEFRVQIIHLFNMLLSKNLVEVHWNNYLFLLGIKLIIFGLLITSLNFIFKKIGTLKQAIIVLLSVMIINFSFSYYDYLTSYKYLLDKSFSGIGKIKKNTLPNEPILTRFIQFAYFADRKPIYNYFIGDNNSFLINHNVHYLVSNTSFENTENIHISKGNENEILERITNYSDSDIVYIYRIKH